MFIYSSPYLHHYSAFNSIPQLPFAEESSEEISVEQSSRQQLEQKVNKVAFCTKVLPFFISLEVVIGGAVFIGLSHEDLFSKIGGVAMVTFALITGIAAACSVAKNEAAFTYDAIEDDSSSASFDLEDIVVELQNEPLTIETNPS